MRRIHIVLLTLLTLAVCEPIAFAGSADSSLDGPVKANAIHIDYKDGIPVFARGLPAYTEIKDPKTGRTWIVQPDGTLNEKASNNTK